jgi:hypothetical protein
VSFVGHARMINGTVPCYCAAEVENTDELSGTSGTPQDFRAYSTPTLDILLVGCVPVCQFPVVDSYVGALHQTGAERPSSLANRMDSLAGADLFTDRHLSHSESGTAETCSVSNGVASTRDDRARKTWRGDIGWVYRFGF